MKILVTCPPMIGKIKELEAEFKLQGAVITCPNVLQTLSESELIDLVPHFDGWIIGDDPVTYSVLKAGKAGQLKAAVKWGVGVDNIDFQAANSLNFPIVNTPGTFGKEVADVAMCYIIGLARDLFQIDHQVRNNKWPKPSGISLASKKVALVGFGDIGSQTARRLQASDMQVVVYDPALNATSHPDIEIAVWPQRLDEADFIIFTCPLNKNTQSMFSHDVLPLLRPGVRLVNVSRGPVVSEDALAKGLSTKIVHSAALDVFEAEPLPNNSKLRDFPQVIFGSHNASNTQDAVFRVSRLAFQLLHDKLKFLN